METKFAISILLLFFAFVSEYRATQQNDNNRVHLSFNILEDSISPKYSFNKDGERHFYLGTNHFVAQDSIGGLSKDGLGKIKMLTSKEFHKLELKKRRSMIDTINKKALILFNDQIFDTIYLYELKENNSISRYKVKWIEEII